MKGEKKMDYVLTTNSLTKKYGDKVAAGNINIHIRKGEIYGLIGRNGAGILTFLIKLLLSIGIGSILMFFAVGLKSKSIALILGVIFGLGALGLLYMGIDSVIESLIKVKGFALSSYMPDTLITKVNVLNGECVSNGIIVGTVCIVLFLILTYIVFKKKDIK